VRQDELARLFGMTRSSVQRVLAALAAVEAAETGYGAVRVADRRALERLGDGA
jgi:DNA-binding IclR family transcriptional regulator